jgi:hypothetical protein
VANVVRIVFNPDFLGRITKNFNTDLQILSSSVDANRRQNIPFTLGL